MLDPQSWLHHAKELTVGRSRRLDHDCGGGRTLKVDHKPDGWGAWCWRCSDKGWVPAPQPSLAERVARLKQKDEADNAAQADPRPPLPANFDPATWPLKPRVWLYKAGLSNARIRAMGAYYVERLDRVVLPVVDKGRLVYWQARGFDPDRPKYLNPAIDKTRLFACYGSDGPVVLTEDILSASRIGEVARGWAIMGTSLSDWQAAELRRENSSALVWLDDDKAGRVARSKVIRTLTLCGIPCRLIRSERDPKLYSREEIRTLINEELHKLV